MDVVTVLGACKDGGNHPVGGGDLAHGCKGLVVKQTAYGLTLTNAVARSVAVLLTVGQSLTTAEVDEVGIIPCSS